MSPFSFSGDGELPPVADVAEFLRDDPCFTSKWRNRNEMLSVLGSSVLLNKNDSGQLTHDDESLKHGKVITICTQKLNSVIILGR